MMQKEKKQTLDNIDRELRRLHALIAYEDISVEHGPDHPVTIVLRQIKALGDHLLSVSRKLQGM